MSSRAQQDSIILAFGNGILGVPYQRYLEASLDPSLCGVIRNTYSSMLMQASNAIAALHARVASLSNLRCLDAVCKPQPACVASLSRTSSQDTVFSLPHDEFQLTGTEQRDRVAYIGRHVRQADVKQMASPDYTYAVVTRLLTQYACPVHYMVITDTGDDLARLPDEPLDRWTYAATDWNWSPAEQRFAGFHEPWLLSRVFDISTFRRTVKPSVSWSDLLLYKHSAHMKR